jgi:hypothetical protein
MKWGLCGLIADERAGDFCPGKGAQILSFSWSPWWLIETGNNEISRLSNDDVQGDAQLLQE